MPATFHTPNTIYILKSFNEKKELLRQQAAGQWHLDKIYCHPVLARSTQFPNCNISIYFVRGVHFFSSAVAPSRVGKIESTRLNDILTGRLLVNSPTAEMDPAEGAGPTIDLTSHWEEDRGCLLYTSPSPRDQRGSRMPSSA